jgi:pyruvate/2-oxoglutarate dehydrogenase complex dihydrolipoamide acyltransferase (E2) component
MVEVKVPDIGDFKEVEVIELMVKPGERVEKDQSLVMVESDKASMEIPSSHAGIVKELKVKLGDKVAEGSLLLMLETEGSAEEKPAPAAAPAAALAPQAVLPAFSKYRFIRLPGSLCRDRCRILQAQPQPSNWELHPRPPVPSMRQ